MRSSNLRRVALTTLAALTLFGQPIAAHAGALKAGRSPLAGSASSATPPGTTIVVKPGADGGWINSAVDGGSLNGSISNYAQAPAGGPAGPGAFRHRLSSGADSATMSSSLFAGRRLDTLTQLAYSTFVYEGTNAPALHIQLDLNGDGFFQNKTVDDEIVFEPIYQTGAYPGESFPSQCVGIPGCVARTAWQTWDARDGGWYSLKMTPPYGPPLKTLRAYAAANPTARIAQGPALFFKSGSGWPGANVLFDGLKVDGVTYDFEPQRVEIAPDSEGLFTRVTQRAGQVVTDARTIADSFQQYSAAIEPLSGRGSLHQRTKDRADRLQMHTQLLAGTPLSELNGLSFATYLRPTRATLASPALSLYLDLNGDGVYQNNSVDDILIFEPYMQHGGTPLRGGRPLANQCDPSACLKTNRWQVWDALNGGWWSRKVDVAGGARPVQRLEAWIAEYPNAKIGLGESSVMIATGSGYADTDAFVDAMNINGTSYDFETQIVTVSPASPNGWITNPLAGSRTAAADRRQDFENLANAPFGAGGLRHRAPTASSTGEDLVAINPMLAGQPIESITELSYRTRVDSTPQGRAPIVKLQVDFDGDNFYTTQATDRLIIFEPVYQTPSSRDTFYGPSYPWAWPDQCGGPCIVQGEWKNWDVLAGNVYFGGQPVNEQQPWDELLSVLRQPFPPGTPETVTRGRVGFGERPISIESDDSFSNYDASVDSITINGVTFDFEAVPPETKIDGERTQEEPYRLLVNDTEAPGNNPLDIAVFGSCSQDAIDFSIESNTPGHDMYVGKLFLDANANDAYDSRPQDRVVSYSVDGTIVEGDIGSPASVPIPGAQVKASPDRRAVEIRLPRAFFGDAWFAYDIWSDASGRNTSWNSFDYSEMKGFIPSPCLPIPEEVFGATPIDCDLYDTDIRLIQYVIDRSASTRLKLSGTCDVSAAAAHGGTTTSIAAAAVAIDRDGVTIESLDMSRRALVTGTGTQAAFYVAPGTEDVTIRGLAFTNLSRPIVAQNSIRTTIGQATALEPLSPLGNRMFGVGSMQEGVLAVGAGNAATAQVKFGSGGSQTRTYPTPVAGDLVGVPGSSGQDLVDIKVLGNYISYRPPGPFTPDSDVTGIVVRQNGGARDVFGVDVSQNAVGMAGSEFPSFNMAGIRIHSDSNDPNFAHIKGVRVFKNTLGRLEELNLSAADSRLPDAGDLQATGRTGIAIGRAQNFLVQGNSIRTILSKVPGLNMPGGGIVVYDSFDGLIETNSVITIAGADTKAADLGAIGVVDNLMNLFVAPGAAPGKPTRSIQIVSNYTGWSGNGPSDVGAQRGLLVSGASKISASLNQFKTISDKSILLGTPVSGPGAALGWAPQVPAQRVAQSSFCRNWLNINRGTSPENAADTPVSQIQWNAGGLGSAGNEFPGGRFQTGNSECPAS